MVNSIAMELKYIKFMFDLYFYFIKLENIKKIFN